MNNSSLELTKEDSVKLFAAIGHVVVRFQQIELCVAETLSNLLGLKDFNDRDVVIAAMSFRQKVDLMIVLLSRNKPSYLNIDIDLVRKALYVAEDFRNCILHSVWAVSNETWIREKASLRSKLGFKKQSICVNIVHLENAADSLKCIRDWESVSSQNLEKAINQLEICKTTT